MGDPRHPIGWEERIGSRETAFLLVEFPACGDNSLVRCCHLNRGGTAQKEREMTNWKSLWSICLVLVAISSLAKADPPLRRSFPNKTLRQIQTKYTSQYIRNHGYGRRYGSPRIYHNNYRHYRHRPFYPGYGVLPVYSYGYPVNSYFYSYNYFPSYSYYLPPVFAPVDPWFGMGALNPFLDLNRLGAAGPVLQAHEEGRAEMEANVALDRVLVQPKVVAPEAPPQRRRSNLTARAQARRWMQAGDNQFVEQKFNGAMQRYQSAAKAAPDMAEPYFRLAHTWIALGQVDRAYKAVTEAISRGADLQRSGFSLGELYGDNHVARNAHIEGLAGRALDDPSNAAILFLIGYTLRYDGQAERADKFFQQAVRLDPENGTYQAFLPADQGL